jgi:hypothetical protein
LPELAVKRLESENQHNTKELFCNALLRRITPHYAVLRRITLLFG